MKTLTKDLKEWIKKKIDSYYRPQYSEAAKRIKKLPKDFVEKSLKSQLELMIDKINNEDPPNVKEFVEKELRLKDYHDALEMIRQKLWKLDLDQENELRELHQDYKNIVEKMNQTDPHEAGNQNVFITRLATDFEAFLSKGRMGSMSSVFGVQGKRIEKAIGILSKKHNFTLLEEYTGAFKSLNNNTRGWIHSVFIWAADLGDSEDSSPAIEDSKKSTHEKIERMIKESNEKDKLGELKKEFDKVCELAMENYKKKMRKKDRQ